MVVQKEGQRGNSTIAKYVQSRENCFDGRCCHTAEGVPPSMQSLFCVNESRNFFWVCVFLFCFK